MIRVWVGFEIAVKVDINLQVSIIPQISCCAVTESNIKQGCGMKGIIIVYRITGV